MKVHASHMPPPMSTTVGLIMAVLLDAPTLSISAMTTYAPVWLNVLLVFPCQIWQNLQECLATFVGPSVIHSPFPHSNKLAGKFSSICVFCKSLINIKDKEFVIEGAVLVVVAVIAIVPQSILVFSVVAE